MSKPEASAASSQPLKSENRTGVLRASGYNGSERVKTRAVKRNFNPAWNEELTLSIKNITQPINLIEGLNRRLILPHELEISRNDGRFVQVKVSSVANKMRCAYTNPSTASGSRAVRTNEFGRTYVVSPKGEHEATIVWLHGLGDNGSSWSQLLEGLPLPNIKWICPAPTRPVSLVGGQFRTAWFDMEEFSEDRLEEFQGLEASAAHIANLLSDEPSDVKLGIGGFCMGGAASLYSATCFGLGKLGNGDPYPINPSVFVSLSGWLPYLRHVRKAIEGTHDAASRIQPLPILLCHGETAEVIPCYYGENSALVLRFSGFLNVSSKTYKGLGHDTLPSHGKYPYISHVWWRG